MTINSTPIKLARAYDARFTEGEFRVLVDRLWPRGVSKEKLRLDAWCKEIAPSDALRKWFDHRVERWDKFRESYRQELSTKPIEVAGLRAIAKTQPLLLIYGAKDEEHNQAVVLREYLLE